MFNLVFWLQKMVISLLKHIFACRSNDAALTQHLGGSRVAYDGRYYNYITRLDRVWNFNTQLQIFAKLCLFKVWWQIWADLASRRWMEWACPLNHHLVNCVSYLSAIRWTATIRGCLGLKRSLYWAVPQQHRPAVPANTRATPCVSARAGQEHFIRHALCSTLASRITG